MHKLHYWYINSSLSEALIVLDDSGAVYYLALGKWHRLVDEVRREFRRATDYELFPGRQETKTERVATTLECVFKILKEPSDDQFKESLVLKFIFGTSLQKEVWKFLITQVAFGETTTYSEIARRLGRVGAARQIGRACGANKIAVLVPCHRVIDISTSLTGYKWGLSLKRYLLSLERQAVRT